MESNSYLINSLKALQKKTPFLKALILLSPSDEKTTLKSVTKTFDFESCKNELALFLFGDNFQALSEYALDWVEKNRDRHVFFVSNDLNSFQRLFQSSVGPIIAEHPQFDFLYTKSPSFWQQHQKQIKSHLGQPFKVINTCENDLSFRAFKDKVTELCVDQNMTFAEYLYTSPIYYENVFQNLTALSQSYSTLSLKNSFKSVPAFICAAGPSINDELETLKICAKKGIMFASGRTLGILSQNGIHPHFLVGVDPHEMHHETFSQQLFFDTPLIYRLRMRHRALEKAQGDLIYCPGAIDYPLIRWLEGQLSVPSFFLDEGLNAVNFSVSLAASFGCNPIVLVGSDLAYQNEKAYSENALLNQKLPDSGALDDDDYSMHRGYYMKNHLGERVYTLWKWKEESQWLSKFAQEHPDISFYNTTLKGLVIENFESTGLDLFLKKTSFMNQDIAGRIHQAIQSISPLNIDLRTIQNIKSLLQKSLNDSQTLLERRTKALIDLQDQLCYPIMLRQLEALFDSVERPQLKESSETRKQQFLKEMIQKYSAILNKLSEF